MQLQMNQQLKTKLTMTQELRQSIELLKLSTYELEQFMVEQQINNPLIELDTPCVMETISFNRSKYTNEPQNENFMQEIICEEEQDFRIQLYKSARLTFTNKKEQKILKKFIFNLDESGYLNESEMIFSEDEYKYALKLLQQIGPPGIGARNLKECLMLQVEGNHPNYDLIIDILENHLEDLANHAWSKMKNKLNITTEMLKDLTKLIQQLNPRPGIVLHLKRIEYLEPDIIVQMKNNELTFQLNDWYLPKISLNKECYNLYKNSNIDKHYLRSFQQNYYWLKHGIEQRVSTITKIIQVLLTVQEKAFIKGMQYLNPQNLKDVADKIQMHESTVSRAISNKIIQTPAGIFKLQEFFTTKVEGVKGKEFAKNYVQQCIQSVILNENKHFPYSDEEIVNLLLESEGIKISRRAVTKYRNEMRIQPSSKRKEL